MVGAKELQEALCHPLVYIEEGTQGSIESFNGTGSPVPLLQEGFDRIQQGIELGTQQVFEACKGTEELPMLLGLLPGAGVIL
jgi:hypothetical protein